MSNKALNISVIIPVYNDVVALNLFLPDVMAQLESFTGQHEILIVDDGSSDDIQGAFEHFKTRLPENIILRLLSLSRNFGKEIALTAGLDCAIGEAVVMMDADGQHPASMLPKMRDLFLQGYDAVVAVQQKRVLESRPKRYLKQLFYRIIRNHERFTMVSGAGDFRMLSRRCVEALKQLPERNRFMKGLYAWVGFRTAYIPFEVSERMAGESKFGYYELFSLAITGFTAFSTKPLRLVSTLGLLVSVMALIYGLYIVISTLIMQTSLPGWPTLAAGMMLLSGVQLISLGLIGEYIGNIYTEVKQRPLYFINQISDSRDDKAS